MSDRILAIVVCFNPKIKALELSLNAVAQQVDAIVIVDNASSKVEPIENIRLGGDQASKPLTILRQNTNLGLGAAHNIGINFAKQESFSHVLLLDQDSVPLPDMVARLYAASKAKAEETSISAVGPKYLNADNGAESFFVRFGWLKFKRMDCSVRDADGCVAADFLISSGSLISLDSIEQIGLMDEGLFIDHVDTEWFLRARSKGFSAYGVCDAIMQHGLGEQTHRVGIASAGNFVRRRNVPQHKPFRYYYIFRNSVNLYKRGYVSSKWKWNDMQRLGMIALMFAVAKAPRKANAKMMLKGAIDGLRGVSGRIDFS